MLWIIQEDLHAKNKNYSLPEALERLGIPFVLVGVAQNQLDPEPVIESGQAVITNGSIMLSNIARSRGWSPGSLFNDNFTYSAWARRYGEMLLNKGARVSSLRDARVTGEAVFARPVLDNKSFNGRVFEPEEFAAFQRASLAGQKGFPRPDIDILVSAPKPIGQEHRHYIVDGEIISSSRYKFAGKPNFLEGADESILKVVQKAINVWTPARAFVMDTYVSGDEIGIVEIGSICHAGMYEADLLKVVAALDAMPLENKADFPTPQPTGSAFRFPGR